MKGKNTVKFGLMSDLHLDIMHDGGKRLNQFLADCEEEEVDFIVNNGDFCYPKDTSRCECSEKNRPVNLSNAMKVPTPVPKLELLERFNTYPKPHYHVLGNHEMDFCSKEETVALYGMPEPYYDFHYNGWHFLVLDPNHYKNEKGEIRDYFYGDYFDYRENLPYLDQKQLGWIRDVLKGSAEPVVIFSHQPLIPVETGLLNYDELQEVFDEVRRDDPHKIRMCIYGHVHLDRISVDCGIIHYSINSISNYWIGAKFACNRYPEETERRFPNLKYVFPYETPLYAIVTIDEQGVVIRGKEGQFERPAPGETGFYGHWQSASIKSRQMDWPKSSLA